MGFGLFETATQIIRRAETSSSHRRPKSHIHPGEIQTSKLPLTNMFSSIMCRYYNIIYHKLQYIYIIYHMHLLDSIYIYDITYILYGILIRIIFISIVPKATWSQETLGAAPLATACHGQCNCLRPQRYPRIPANGQLLDPRNE